MVGGPRPACAPNSDVCAEVLALLSGGIKRVEQHAVSFFPSWTRSFGETKSVGVAAVQPGRRSQVRKHAGDSAWRLLFACMHDCGPDISPEVSHIRIASHLPYVSSICPSFHHGLPLLIPLSSRPSTAKDAEAFWTVSLRKILISLISLGCHSPSKSNHDRSDTRPQRGRVRGREGRSCRATHLLTVRSSQSRQQACNTCG